MSQPFDTMVDAMLSGEQKPALAAREEGEEVPIRAQRSNRGQKRHPDDVHDAEHEAVDALLTASPAKVRRTASQRAVALKLEESDAGKASRQAQLARRQQRAPRSPDEKRKLSRQMAAYMRFGVLALPANVKLNKKNGKKDDGDGLEYRQAFNLLLDLCFGDSHKAWAHCANHFYLHAILIEKATDGAVKLDPVQEAKLDEHALLRKASDQQNAQWRVNEARLRFLGIKKEQLTKVFKQVADGKPIQLPPPPAEALWTPAIRARRQAADEVAASPAAAKGAKKEAAHTPAAAAPVPKHRQGATGGRTYTGFSPAALAAPLGAGAVASKGRTAKGATPRGDAFSPGALDDADAAAALQNSRDAAAHAAAVGAGHMGMMQMHPMGMMPMAWYPHFAMSAGLPMMGSSGLSMGHHDMMGAALAGSSLMQYPGNLPNFGAHQALPSGGVAAAAGGGGQSLGSFLASLWRSTSDPNVRERIRGNHSFLSGMDQSEFLRELTRGDEVNSVGARTLGGQPPPPLAATAAQLPPLADPPLLPEQHKAEAETPVKPPAAIVAPSPAPLAAALAAATGAFRVDDAADGVPGKPTVTKVVGETDAEQLERLVTRVGKDARELTQLLRRVADLSRKTGQDAKVSIALSDLQVAILEAHNPHNALDAQTTVPYEPGPDNPKEGKPAAAMTIEVELT